MLKKPNYFLSVWVTDECNLRCKYCFYNSSDIFSNVPKRMDEKTADAISGFINSGNVSGVSFFGAEPLMNWKIIKRILVKSHLPLVLQGTGIKKSPYNVTTNATLITDAIAEELKLNDVFINISIDGLPAQQNIWRSGSYDATIKGFRKLDGYPLVQALKTLVTPETMYDDVKHIRDLGFKRMFINLLDAFGGITYEDKDPVWFKEEYKRTIKDLHHPPEFSIGDYQQWQGLLTPGKERKLGCGFVNRGLGVDPEGFFYPCHQGPTLNNREQFRIGNVFTGVDLEREKVVRSVKNCPTCHQCPLQLSKCYVTMFNKYGKFGIDSPTWHRQFELAKIEAIFEMEGWTLPPVACRKENLVFKGELLLATIMSRDKQYLLKPFLSSLLNLDLPITTDYVIVIDATDDRLYFLLQKWVEGKAIGLPDPRGKFRSLKVIKMPIIQNERFMWRITRGRNMVLGIARNNPSYAAYAFIDADILVEKDTLKKLLSVPDGIVGALVKCRRDDKEGWYNNYVKDGTGFRSVRSFTPGDILKVDATGSDCILIYRDVFIGQNYEYKPEIPEAEDMGFCFKAKERGFEVRIHTGAKTHHILVGDVEVKSVE